MAFGEFYEQHWHQLLVCLTRQVGDAETGVDLMSETFAVALEKCSQFRGTSPAEEAGWLYSIARTQLSRYWRSGRVERAALARLGVQTAELTDPEIDRIEVKHLQQVARDIRLINARPSSCGWSKSLPIRTLPASWRSVSKWCGLGCPAVCARSLSVSNLTRWAEVCHE